MYPIIPNSTKKVLNTMNLSIDQISLNNISNLNCFDHKKEINNIDILFTKIENDN